MGNGDSEPQTKAAYAHSPSSHRFTLFVSHSHAFERRACVRAQVRRIRPARTSMVKGARRNTAAYTHTPSPAVRPLPFASQPRQNWPRRAQSLGCTVCARVFRNQHAAPPLRRCAVSHCISARMVSRIECGHAPSYSCRTPYTVLPDDRPLLSVSL